MESIRTQLTRLGDHYDFPEPTVDVARVRERNETFMRKAGICANEQEFRWYLKIDNAQIGCMAYCREPEEIAQLGADLIAWLFHFDDKIGEGKGTDTVETLKARLDGFHAVVSMGEVNEPECKFQVALHGLVERGVAMGGEAWRAKFARSFAWYFNGLLGEFRVRFQQAPLNLEAYRIIRRQSIAGYPIMDLIDLQFGKVVDHPELEQLRHQTSDMLGWVNDLCSTDKEGLDGDPINLASVVARDYGLSFEEGFAQAVSLVHDPDWKLFLLRQKKILESDAPDEVKACALSLRKWVESTYHWSFRTRRYTDIHNDRLEG